MLCECGCGVETTKYYGIIRRFIHGHNGRGKPSPMSGHKQSNEHIQEMKNNKYAWKGDDVGYHGLHTWLRRHTTKPKSCEFCDNKPPKHLACITGIYNRDFVNYKYLCQTCHENFDIKYNYKRSKNGSYSI